MRRRRKFSAQLEGMDRQKKGYFFGQKQRTRAMSIEGFQLKGDEASHPSARNSFSHDIDSSLVVFTSPPPERIERRSFNLFEKLMQTDLVSSAASSSRSNAKRIPKVFCSFSLRFTVLDNENCSRQLISQLNARSFLDDWFVCARHERYASACNTQKC
jgi:hypothetical protein